MGKVTIRKESATRFTVAANGLGIVSGVQQRWTKNDVIILKMPDGELIKESYVNYEVFDLAATEASEFASLAELLDILDEIGFANFNLGEAAPSPSNIYNQNNITFTNNVGDYFGSVDSPRTGILTFDTAGAVRGGIAIIYYQNATLQMPSVWRTRGNFVPNEVNKIYLERDGEGFVTCNIISTSSDSTPTATAPTITVTDI